MPKPDDGTLILITGIPGSGKTTLANGLSDLFGWPVLSAGDIARAVDPASIASGLLASEAEFRDAFIAAQRMIPVDQTTIIDGLPRTLQQVTYVELPYVMTALHCRQDIAIDRLSRRGREDDTQDIVLRRVQQQYNLLGLDVEDGWLRRMLPWGLIVETSRKTPEQVLEGYRLYFTGERRQAF